MRILEKTERRLGEKLFLKGERCVGPKCAAVRKNYPPGIHGRKRRRSASEYGRLLREKQKARFLYGLANKEIARYIKKAVFKQGLFGSLFIRMLESRLDNVVFRFGFAQSRRSARFLVSHGHVLVNGKTLNIPSYQAKKGDVVTIKERTLSSPILGDLEVRIKKYNPPKWLNLDKSKKAGEVIGQPDIDSSEILADVMKIKEFYSR